MEQLDRAIAQQYDVFTECNVTTYVVKTHDDHPYRLTFANGIYTLRQAYRDRTYAKCQWYKIASGQDRLQVLQRLARRHNTACKYMVNWKVIPL